MIVTLYIPGKPIAQGRPRFTARGGFARAYDPKTSRDYKQRAASIARDVMAGGKPMAGPIGCEISFIFPRPKSDTSGTFWRAKRPDLDNLAKAIWDACEGIVYNDDKQIVAASITKGYAINSTPNVTAQFFDILQWRTRP